jgi:hypothetical protein
MTDSLLKTFLDSPASIRIVRGERRSGKTSLLQAAAMHLDRPFAYVSTWYPASRTHQRHWNCMMLPLPETPQITCSFIPIHELISRFGVTGRALHGWLAEMRGFTFVFDEIGHMNSPHLVNGETFPREGDLTWDLIRSGINKGEINVWASIGAGQDFPAWFAEMISQSPLWIKSPMEFFDLERATRESKDKS